MPPNGQGIAALLALDILDGLRPGRDARESSGLHLQIEAMKLGFADAHALRRRPASRSHVPPAGLLDPATLAARRALIGRAAPGVRRRATRPAAARSTSAPPTPTG